MAAMKDVKMKIRRWEEQNLVYGSGYVDKSKGMGKSLSDNMQRRGYDAMRISPGITKKFGLPYRAVYGTQIQPNYNMQRFGAKSKKFYPSVKWFKQGYIKAGKAKGTVILNRSILSQFQRDPLMSLLMYKKRKR